MELDAVILAAGQGTRMKSVVPKVLHPLAGKPLVTHVLDAVAPITGAPPVLVIGHGGDQVRSAIGGRARYAVQTLQLGTGHAVMQARHVVGDGPQVVLVTYADMPLITTPTLQALLDRHLATNATVTMLTVLAEDPRGFGRVIRDADGRVRVIVEEADCTPDQLSVRELNAGVYCFDAPWLWATLPGLPASPKGEYYLTDTVGAAVAAGLRVEAVICRDPVELLGINNRVHLAEAEQAFRSRINRGWMEAGVTIEDPAATYIEGSVLIGPDTVLLANTHLLGDTAVGRRCRIGPGTVIVDSTIGDDCTVMMSVLEGALLPDGSDTGPFAHVREGARRAAVAAR